MDQFVCLLSDGRDDLRVAMSCGTNSNAGVAVQKDVTVRVSDPNSAGVVRDKFVIGPRVARRNVLRVRVDDLERLRPWQGSFDNGLLQFCCWCHDLPPKS